MVSDYPSLVVRVWGELACFTRPEMKVERVTYPIMTPLAARGVLEAIFWKPEFTWRVEEIWVLKPINYFSILRNEVNSRASERAAAGWQQNGGSYDASSDRAQRHTLALRDVAYLIRAHIEVRPDVEEDPAKFRDQFRRRVRDGRCFATPYLGCREFAAAFAEPNGSERPVTERLQAKIKGVPGGQTSGTAIISANAEAFESYGLTASLIAPTCADCGERFTKAANSLLANDTHCIRMGGAAFVFWTRKPVAFDFRIINNPEPQQVRNLLESVRTGDYQPDPVDQTQFYATVLSSSGGRAVVRDWIDTTVGEAKRHLTTWFQRQRIVGEWGEEEPRPLGLYALAAATVRDPRKELAPPTPRALWRAALTGAPLPSGLLYQAVRRNRAEQGLTRSRAALIKLVLLSQQSNSKEDAMVQLDPENPSPAYRCGRLLAVLEAVQRLALPGVKATIVDRFFGTASSAPASVFGRLLRGAQPHLAKLERDRPGAYVALQRRLEDVQAGLTVFPRTLTLEEQGLFALGYYHQRAFDRAQAREATERRKAGGAPAPEEDLIEALEDTQQDAKEEN